MRNIIIIVIFLAIILLLDRVMVPIEPESFHQAIITYSSDEFDFETCSILFGYILYSIELSGTITGIELETLIIPSDYELKVKPFTVIESGTTLAIREADSIISPFHGSIMAITGHRERILHFIDYEKVKIQAIVNLEQFRRIHPNNPFTFRLNGREYKAYLQEVALTPDYAYRLLRLITLIPSLLKAKASVLANKGIGT